MNAQENKARVLSSLARKCLSLGDQKLSAEQIQSAITDLKTSEVLVALRELWYERQLKACWALDPTCLPESVLLEETAIRAEIESETSEATFLTDSWDEILRQHIITANDLRLSAILKDVPLPETWKASKKTLRLILKCYKDDLRVELNERDDMLRLRLISDEHGYAKSIPLQW